MAKRDPLRELSRRFPAPPEFEKILHSLGDQADITIAIVGTAAIEGGLEKLLLHHFGPLDPELQGKLFKSRGPISDFDGKILIAEALKIITPRQSKKLNSLKAIRNVFAHAKGHVTFETSEIANEIKSELYALAVDWIRIMDPEYDEPLSNKRAFTVWIKIFCWMLNDDHFKKTGQPLYWPDLHLLLPASPEKSE
jgi:hypothetical protein